MCPAITIYTAPTRYNLRWNEERLDWLDFADRCASPVITNETAEQFRNFDKKQQCETKDVGGFVGGRLKDGRRRTGSVQSRSLITLDYDHCAPVPMDEQPVIARLALMGVAALIYTTHSHSTDAPRFRVVVPLSSELTPRQYEHTARKFAAQLGTDGIDSTTYDAERLFFWPSASVDAQFYFDRFTGPFLNPAPYLEDLPDEAPQPAMGEGRTGANGSLGDPAAKGGVIGAFCKAYDVHAAIEKFIPDVYIRYSHNRYTYANGSTAGGLTVYPDGWCESHHDSDPATGHAINAFDLVRVHMFGGSPYNPDKKYIDDMVNFAKSDPAVMAVLRAERHAAEVSELEEVSTGNDSMPVDTADTPAKRGRKKKELPDGMVPDTIEGARRVIVDTIGGNIWFNEFSRSIMIEGGLPWNQSCSTWTENDFNCLRAAIEPKGATKETKIRAALSVVLLSRSRHPVKEYLAGCAATKYTPGDLERLFIDYLGAEDTPYNRAVCRMFFVAAVARIYQPGCKFDYCPVLQGPQGIGKSTVLNIMGGKWFSDSLTNIEGKEGMEQLRDKWLLELGELSAVRRSDIEAVKAFISRQIDSYRAAYAREVENWPRQCVMAATTNQEFYLKGDSNRRFLPVKVGVNKAAKSPWQDLPQQRDALWAEAIALYQAGTDLYLSAGLEQEARGLQISVNEDQDNPFVADLEVYLGQLLPWDWDKWDSGRRRQFFLGVELNDNYRLIPRMRACPREFLYEYYGVKPSDYGYKLKSNDVAKAFARLGWSSVGMSRHCQKAYGLQKSFERPRVETNNNIEPDEDEL